MRTVRQLTAKAWRPPSRARRLRFCLLGTLVLALAVSACTGAEGATTDRSILAVAAASDLRPAFDELGTKFEDQTGARVVFQYGSSGTLARQIEQGAPVDLFASASEEYVDYLVEHGAALAETRRLYALGRITLVYKREGSPSIAGLADLTAVEVRHVAIANPEHAPYGRAAREALERAGLWEELRPKIVYGENVQQALQFVQTGNADAGIVALSIAGSAGVEVLHIDDSLYTPLRQSLVVVKGAKQADLARDFASFVTGAEGRAVMERYGFALPDEG